MIDSNKKIEPTESITNVLVSPFSHCNTVEHFMTRYDCKETIM